MLPKRAWVRVTFTAAWHSTEVRFICRVDVRVLLTIARVGETTITTRKFTDERLLSRVSALVNLEVFRARKRFAAVCKGARERLFSRVNANVIDKLVLGFERLAAPVTLIPLADV